jgi:hypothetical protein
MPPGGIVNVTELGEQSRSWQNDAIQLDLSPRAFSRTVLPAGATATSR